MKRSLTTCLCLLAWYAFLFSLGCQKESDKREEDGVPAEHHVQSAAASNNLPQPPPGLLPQFVTIGPESGLNFERQDDISRFRRIMEVNGGGAALFDFDGDGLLDVFLTNGCQLPIARSDRRSKGELFQNKNGLQFNRVTELSQILQLGYAYGCTVGDYNADGFDDLYITAFGRNALWENNGDGTFSDVTDESGTQANAWSSSAAFADVNRDGHLDLYVVNYLDESDSSPRLCPNSASPDGFESCSPSLFDGVDDFLLISDGKGHFIDATKQAGIAGLKGKGLGVVVSDLDKDGEAEIYVANDGQANFLFVPTGSQSESPTIPRYEDRAVLQGVALNESGYAQASMGIAVGDYDANGFNDLFLTHFYSDTNTLYSNNGGLVFQDATRKSRLGASSRLLLGWGTVFFDSDNDGWLDLFAANGHIEDRTWMDLNVPYRMTPLMYRNEHDGTFANVSNWSGDYFKQQWLGRGAAAGDLDRDNKMDLVVSHQLGPALALHNVTETPFSAVTLKFVGQQSTRNGFGVRVERLDAEPPVIRELIGGGSFQSASAPEIHFGLNKDSEVSIRIQWPSGLEEIHKHLTPGYWVMIEGQGKKPLPSMAHIEEKE